MLLFQFQKMSQDELFIGHKSTPFLTSLHTSHPAANFKSWEARFQVEKEVEFITLTRAATSFL